MQQQIDQFSFESAACHDENDRFSADKARLSEHLSIGLVFLNEWRMEFPADQTFANFMIFSDSFCMFLFIYFIEISRFLAGVFF